MGAACRSSLKSSWWLAMSRNAWSRGSAQCHCSVAVICQLCSITLAGIVRLFRQSCLTAARVDDQRLSRPVGIRTRRLAAEVFAFRRDGGSGPRHPARDSRGGRGEEHGSRKPRLVCTQNMPKERAELLLGKHKG